MCLRPKDVSVVLVLAAVCLGQVKLTEDPPPLPKPRSGDLKGTITPAGRIDRLRLTCRAAGKAYRPISWDRATGRFVFKNLPGDATYDICLRMTDGRQIEGIDLDFNDHRLLRLAAIRRKELALPPERTHCFSMDDVKLLMASVAKMKDFMEIRRPLYIKGHGRRATMLVELMRTREHYAGKDRNIWRVELWYYENNFGGWERAANTERVLRRRRIAPREWAKIAVEYRPELSVYVSPEGLSRRVEFRVPDKIDPSRGRPANTPPELKTKPHVLGLEVKGPPASRPAATE